MDLTFCESELAFRDELRAWFADHDPVDEPVGDEDAHYHWRARLPARGWPTDGWAAVHWPVEYGGRGATLTQSAIFFEELGRSGAPLPANVLGLLLAGPTIMAWGTPEQKERYLNADPDRRGDLVPGLLRARRRLGPGRGQDPRRPRRRRLGRHRPEGLDQRRPVLEVVHAGGAHRPRGGQAQGAHLLPDGHGAGRRSRSGRCARSPASAEFNELFIDGARIPDENLLGGEGNGWKVALTTLMNERAGLAFFLQVRHAPDARPADRRRPPSAVCSTTRSSPTGSASCTSRPRCCA